MYILCIYRENVIERKLVSRDPDQLGMEMVLWHITILVEISCLVLSMFLVLGIPCSSFRNLKMGFRISFSRGLILVDHSWN
jgi:hypothetical protein